MISALKALGFILFAGGTVYLMYNMYMISYTGVNPWQ